MSFEYCHLVEFRNACQCSLGRIARETVIGAVPDEDTWESCEIGRRTSLASRPDSLLLQG
jgi:hypothetical protein